jgi:hypothetical protein
VLLEFELAPELSRVVVPAVLVLVVDPVDPLPLRETECPLSDGDPDDAWAGVDREGLEDPAEDPPDDAA